MILPVGPTAGQDQDLLRVVKDENGTPHVERLFPVRFVPLVEGLPVGNG